MRTILAEYKAMDRSAYSIQIAENITAKALQTWWSYYATRTRLDGDGRPISLTLWKAVNGVIRNFRIQSPPFWSNAVAQSNNIIYDSMFVNATNTDPLYKGQK
jgi:galacturan 1,4-alpha-galacturonidase